MLPDILFNGQWALIQPAHINKEMYAISFQADGSVIAPIKSMKHSYTTIDTTVNVLMNDGKVTYGGQLNPQSTRIVGKALTSNQKESWSFELERMTWLEAQTPPGGGALFSNTQFNDQTGVWALRAYHSYRIAGQRNPDFDGYSSKVLDLKNLFPSAIEYFYNRLNPIIFGDDVAICYVPSSDPANVDTGIRRLGAKLATQPSRVDATACLVRTKKIDKLATGGSREIAVHLGSIAVAQTALIKGKTVLLIDDVTTSHNSLLAGKQLLLAAGAKNVYCLALAQT